MSVVPIAKFSPSMLERAFFTFTTVNYEKIEKGMEHPWRKEFFINCLVCLCSPYQGRSGNAMWLKWLGGLGGEK